MMHLPAFTRVSQPTSLLVLILSLTATPAAAQLLALGTEEGAIRFLSVSQAEVRGETRPFPALRGLVRLEEQSQLAVLDGGLAQEGARLHWLSVVNGSVVLSTPLPGCEEPSTVAIGGPATLLVGCSRPGLLLELDSRTGQLLRSISTQPGIDEVLWHPHLSAMVVLRSAEAKMVTEDPVDGVLNTLWSGAKPDRVRLGPEGSQLVILSGSERTISFLEPEGGVVNGPLRLQGRPTDALILGDHSGALVTTEEPGALVGIDFIDNELRVLELKTGASGLALEYGDRRAWVSSKEGNLVYEVDLKKWEVEASYPVPGGPTTIFQVQ